MLQIAILLSSLIDAAIVYSDWTRSAVLLVMDFKMSRAVDSSLITQRNARPSPLILSLLVEGSILNSSYYLITPPSYKTFPKLSDEGTSNSQVV